MNAYAAVSQRLPRRRQHKITTTMMTTIMNMIMMVTDGTGAGLPESKKTSTMLKGQMSPAQRVRNRNMFDTRQTPQSRAPPSHRPHMDQINNGKHRTFAAREYGHSVIRQRRGGKTGSSHAESSSGPSPAPHIENVNNIGMAATACVARDISEQAQ